MTLDNTAAERKIKRLTKLLDFYDRRYRLGEPAVSDAEYDALYRELEELERQYPNFALEHSPTQMIGSRTALFSDVVHAVPMYSLENKMSQSDFLAFDKYLHRINEKEPGGLFGIEYFCEPKLDGLAVSIDYADSVLNRGATRGDGYSGKDITHNIRAILSLPHILDRPFTGTVRGEVYIRKYDFSEINKQRIVDGEEPFANPRNAAAGSLRQIDSSIAAKRSLSIHFYALVDAVNHHVSTQAGAIEFMRDLGLPVVEHTQICTDAGAVIRYHDKMGKRRELPLEDEGVLPFEIDGIVVKLNDLTQWERIGYTAKSPRYMIAYKWPEQVVATRLNDVTFQIGRQGVFSPVAELEPVEFGGVTVKRATLHNASEIARLGLMLNDEVYVKRGGEVIPKILGRTDRERDGTEAEILYPANCPHCGSELVGDIRAHNLACPNRECPGRLAERLAYFASRGVMDIEGMSGKTAKRLVSEKLVHDVDGIYRLKREQLVALERFAEVSVDNLLAAIESSKRQPLWRVVTALEIPQVGAQTAKLLAREFGSMDSIAEASRERLEQVHGIGSLMAEDIMSWFADEQNRALMDRLAAAGLRMTEDTSGEKPGYFAGKTVVLTGTISFASRDQLKDWLELNGATVSSSVSKRTSLVIAGANPGTKHSTAQQLGVEIWDETLLNEFMRDQPSLPVDKPAWWPL